MSNTFHKYAEFYDLLYEDKDYSAEANYVYKKIIQYFNNPKKLLDVGCGTGFHAFYLNQKGILAKGIDISAEMIESAKEKYRNIMGLQFFESTSQNFHFDEKFDVITSLFHVMVYNDTNEKLEKAFENIYNHLSDGGIFLFDFWHGPAVLYEKPSIRVKILQNEDYIVHRIATPTLLINDNIVEVNYEIIAQNKKTLMSKNFKEQHRVRYFFLPELKLIFNKLGFKILEFTVWMQDNKIPDVNSWYVFLVLKK